MPLVFEHWPTRLRGLISGLVLGGWYWGYLLAAAAFQFLYPVFSETDYAWRMMLWIGIVPALLTFWIRARVTESPIWVDQQRRRQQLKDEGRSTRQTRSRSCDSSSRICCGSPCRPRS
jgi:MFS transporter, SHS family, lactate transporter